MPAYILCGAPSKKKAKMSDDISKNDSLLEAFNYLQIDNHTDDHTLKFDSSTRQVASATHDLPCKMPQTAGDMDNCDETASESESDSDSDVIVVVDTSDELSEVSFISPSDLSRDSDVGILDWDSYEETIPETESDSDTHGITTGPNTMDKLVSTPIKRKHDHCPNSKEKESNSVTPKQQLELDTTPIKTTRSGRHVRQRIDHKFDYSSEQTENSDDPDFSDEFADDDDEYDDNDDDENDEDYIEQEHTQPTRKSRLSFRSSCCSSSDNSLMEETDAIIYLDLRQPVAIAYREPTTDSAVEFDSNLKTRLKKFLGLMPAQRRLYNPMDNYELEEHHVVEDDNLPMQNCRLWSTSNTSTSSSSAQSGDQTKAKRTSQAKHNISKMPSLLKTLGSTLTNEMKMLLIDDIVQRANANCFESQTPDHIKESIDLSGLPSEEQRAQNCQQHKKIPNLLEPCAGYYSFLDSLKSETPMNLCHPLAVKYRQRDFEASRTMLAKMLFNALNHTIFHCGLRTSITWKSAMNTPSSVVHGFDSSGQRMSRIILWQHLKQPGVLVKALLHEMCHAAAFVYHGETGHGDYCRKWAYRAKSLLPELPQINDCNANYKYTCLMCSGRSFGIMKFENEEQQLRCHYCQFEVNVEICNSEDAHNLSLTDQLVTPYKLFVRANYTKCEENSHSAKMRSLNIQYKDNLKLRLQHAAAN